ncbi:hypothetical protein BH10ACI2_BH10ACI2_24620 [soil metagenome]
MNKSTHDEDGYDESEIVKSTVFIPLGIFVAVVGVWAIVKLCQIYVPAQENTKAAIDALLGLFTLVVIIVQSIILNLQWKAMRKGLKFTRKQARISKQALEIARLSLNAVKLTQRPEIDLRLRFEAIDSIADVSRNSVKFFKMQFEAFNAGKTTAYNFGIHISGDYKPRDFDGVLDYGDPTYKTAEPIRPGRPKYIHPGSIICQPDQFERVMNRIDWLIIYGIIWYEDGAGERYSEPYCRRFDPNEPNDAIECDGVLRSQMVAILPRTDA